MARDERVMWSGEIDTEMPEPGSEEEYWIKWMREVEETGSEEDTWVREGRKERRWRREKTDRPCTMKPLISLL
jgi:hypothetical protein